MLWKGSGYIYSREKETVGGGNGCYHNNCLGIQPVPKLYLPN